MNVLKNPKLVLVGALAALTVIFGGWRASQLTFHQPAEEVRFGPTLNHLTWDPPTGRLTSTGDDPYAFLQIPADSIPLDELVIECSGRAPVSRAFIYRSPAYSPDVTMEDGLIVASEAEPTPDGYRFRFALGGSKIARLDLPDDLTEPLLIREIVFRSHFLVGANPTFYRFAMCLGALVIVLIWLAAEPYIKRFRAFEFACVVLLVGTKLWLAGDMHLKIGANETYDDALFMAQGLSIANGDWLGPFGELTLAKGPTYSVFLALVQHLRIPLLDAQAFFHALACVVLLIAVTPLVRSPGTRLLLVGVLLFDPHPFSAEVSERALRSGIQPALTLLTLAGSIGIRARLAGSLRSMVPWAILAGLAFAAFWFSREEGIWLVPTLLLIAASGVGEVWRGRTHDWIARIACLLLPFAIWYSALWTLRAVNHHYYHAWISVDMKDGAFPRAYGALTRITPQVEINGIPVSKETRLRAYAVSPAFAELQPLLEGRVGRAWATHGWKDLAEHTSAGKEIRGGWFAWALRDAAFELGYYRDAATASQYWQRVADEINAACDDGRLAGGRKRSGFAPRWDSSLIQPMGRALLVATGVVVRFSDYRVQENPSRGSLEKISLYSREFHEPPVTAWLPPTFRSHCRMVVFRSCQIFSPLALAVALCATVVIAARSRRTLLNARLAITFALLGGATALIILVSLVDVTSFSALHAMYLAPATPLVLCACILAPYWARRYRCELQPAQ